VFGDSGGTGSHSQRGRGRSRSIVGPPDVESTGSGSSSSHSDSSALRHAEWLLPKPAGRHHRHHEHSHKRQKSPVEKQVLRRVGQSAGQGNDEQKAKISDVGQAKDVQSHDVQFHDVKSQNVKSQKVKSHGVKSQDIQPDGSSCWPPADHGDDDNRKTKITWCVEEADVSSQGQAGGEVSVEAAIRSSKHDDGQTSDSERDTERRTEMPILVPLSAYRRRLASWPPTAADAARASRVKSRHRSRRPSPSAVVAAAIIEPEPETCHTKPEEDNSATEDSGVVNEQLLHVYPVHGERLACTSGLLCITYIRYTASDCRSVQSRTRRYIVQPETSRSSRRTHAPSNRRQAPKRRRLTTTAGTLLARAFTRRCLFQRVEHACDLSLTLPARSRR